MTAQTRGSSVPQLLERDVETPNGRVFVTEMPGEDPPIVLLHGFPDDHRIYSELLARLSPRRAVAFDFVGYGRSERKDGAHFSPEDHGAEITAVLDALDIDRAILVGHDASGPDAVIYALTSPQRVAHVVLMNTVFGNRPSLKMPEMTRLFSDPQLTTLADDMVGDPNQLFWLLTRWGQQLGVEEGTIQKSILAQFYGDDQQPDAIASIRAWTAVLRDALDQQEVLVDSGALRRLEVPVSIIWGETDAYLTPSLATEIAALFPGPSVHFIPGVGHYVQHGRPDEVAGLLKGCEDFLPNGPADP
jgi:pimeloyl-ACP methyl ester carboxylesterase